MEEESKPLAVLFGRRTGSNKLTFVGRNGYIDLFGRSKTILRLLSYCNGARTLSKIRKKLFSVSDKIFWDIIKTCRDTGIITDSRSLYYNFHEDSANPSKFSSDISPAEVAKLQSSKRRPVAKGNALSLPRSKSELLNLTRNRITTRKFKDINIELSVLCGLLEATYQVGDYRSTPSAGGLYPLELYLAVLSQKQDIPMGIYQYCPERHILVRTDKELNRDNFVRILDSTEAIKNCAAVVFIAADLKRSATKYANRGYRFTLLEAGHSAQNAYLYCTENKLGLLEYGGFNDEYAAEELGLEYPNQAVLICLIIGTPGDNDRSSGGEMEARNLAWDLEKSLVGAGRPLKSVRLFELRHKNYRMPRVLGAARYRPAGGFKPKCAITNLVAFSNGATSYEALIKVIAEGYERYSSGKVRIDRVEKASDLDLDSKWLDPRFVTPLTSEQYGFLQDLEPFSPERKWQWVEGRRYLTSERIYVPIDNVFFPISENKIERKLCYWANSSGVAAHTDYQEAISHGLLELIERDAIGVAWYTERPVSAIPLDWISESLQRRASFWFREGHKIKFVDLTLDSVPVVLALIYNPDVYPCLVSGAAASYTYDAAITKALDEAEYMLLSWLKGKPRWVIEPKAVIRPEDHGVLYFSSKNLDQVDWLLSSCEQEPKIFREVDIFSVFDPIIVDLNREEKHPQIYAVRVISENLLPLNFGYGNEHLAHKRLTVLGLKWSRDFPSFPHFFA